LIQSDKHNLTATVQLNPIQFTRVQKLIKQDIIKNKLVTGKMG